MILDMESLNFIEKSLTRTEAKKVHKDLPEGGVWKTVKGHHIYIVGNKIVAGSIPGVTKAKKMTKATMAEHQAALDAKGKKKDGKQSDAKKKPATKATGKAKPKSGSNPGGTKTKTAGAAKTSAKPAAKKKPAVKPKAEPKKVEKPKAKTAPKKELPKKKTFDEHMKETKAALDDMLGAPKPHKEEPKPEPKVQKVEAKSTENPKLVVNIPKEAHPLEAKAKQMAKESSDFYDWANKLNENPDVKKHLSDKYVKSSENITYPELYEKFKNGDKQPINTEKAPDSHYEVYHGTRLPNVDKILQEGFKPNGNEDDFGDAAYFKSPSFDKHDHDDWKKWLAGREEKGHPIPKGYKERRGHDTQDIVHGFSRGKEPAIIRAFIPKEHVLDCTKGRPEELSNIIKDFDSNTGSLQRKRVLLNHLLGMNMDKDTPYSTIMEAFDKYKDEMAAKWGGKFMPGKISPYEVYAKKHGIKAIVDKLNHYDEEGWQVGVYDPSIIQIKEHGTKIRYNDEKKNVELMKALRKQKSLPYCLLHHHIDEDGLHLHIGATGGKRK